MAEGQRKVAPAEDGGNVLEPCAGAEKAGRPRSRQVGDLPARIADRYIIEEKGLRREIRLFESPRDQTLAIRDLGHRLIQTGESQAMVRDLLDIAAHRGWDRIRVTGSDSFRRMVAWEAKSRSIEVEGMRGPDRAMDGRTPNSSPVTPAPNRDPANGRRTADFQEGVKGVVMDIGSAVYQDRPGRKPSPFVDIRTADGQVRRVWGAGLPAALARTQIEIGDEVLLRQEPAAAATGRRSARTWTAERMQGERGRNEQAQGSAAATYERLGERFRRLDDRARAQDPELQAAQSQLIAAKALARAYFAHDPATAAVLGAKLQDSIVTALDKGRRFTMARTRDRGDGHKELVLNHVADRPHQAASRMSGRGQHPEITKAKDRGRRR